MRLRERVSHVIKYILFHTAYMSLHPQYAIDRILVMHFQLIAASEMNNSTVFIASQRGILVLNKNFDIFKIISLGATISLASADWW